MERGFWYNLTFPFPRQNDTFKEPKDHSIRNTAIMNNIYSDMSLFFAGLAMGIGLTIIIIEVTK